MTRITGISAAAAAAFGLGLGGWAGAAALKPPVEPASAGRVLQLRYEVRREPAYVPPAPQESTRLEVLSTAPATGVDDGVLSAQSAAAVRQLAAEDDRRAAAALAAARADDARYDRETRAALADVDAGVDRPSHDG